MHGIIFQELQKYVEQKLGREAWTVLLDRAEMPERVFLPTESYPDEDVVKLVTTASAITEQETSVILQDFGTFLVPDLLQIFGSMVPAEWKTLDLIEQADAKIHAAVMMKHRNASPPALECERPDDDTVIMEYRSPRHLCDVAKGIAQGVANHYGEKIEIAESECMNKGDERCLLEIKRVG